jgi:flagellar protein FliS
VAPTTAYQAAGNAYRSNGIATASPSQLVLMLYDGAQGAIARAEQAMFDRDAASIDVVNRELTRAQDIVTELMISLDHEFGGDIARNLEAIYQYCLSILTRANLQKRADGLDEVRRHLGGLREAFADAAATAGTGTE